MGWGNWERLNTGSGVWRGQERNLGKMKAWDEKNSPPKEKKQLLVGSRVPVWKLCGVLSSKLHFGLSDRFKEAMHTQSVFPHGCFSQIVGTVHTIFQIEDQFPHPSLCQLRPGVSKDLLNCYT